MEIDKEIYEYTDMTFIVDIDDTIMTAETTWCKCGNYTRIQNVEPLQDEIDRMNRLFDKGHIMIIHTARRWDHYEITKQQLEELGVKYHELVMGKPQGVYIDSDSCKSFAEWEIKEKAK